MVYGMELVVKSDMEQGIVESDDDTRIPMELINENKQEQIPTAVVNKQLMPNLNLSANLQKKPSMSLTSRIGPKTPVKSLQNMDGLLQERKIQQQLQTDRKQLQTDRKQLQTDRSGTRHRSGTRRGSGEVTQDSVVIDMSTRNRKKSMLPKVLNDNGLMANIAQEINYSPEEVWDFLRDANPSLYKFGKAHGMSLDDVAEYAHLLQKFRVEPQALVEVVKTHNKLENRNAADWQLKKYEGIQKKDPDKYAMLVLDAIKASFDQQDGQQGESPLNNTHIGLLEDQVTNDQKTKRNLWIAIGVKLVFLIIGAGGTIWGIYGQTQAGNTLAPTGAPTNAPTYAPTFAPV